MSKLRSIFKAFLINSFAASCYIFVNVRFKINFWQGCAKPFFPKKFLIYSNFALWLSGWDNCTTFVIKNNSDIGETFFVISCCWKAVEGFWKEKNVPLLLMLFTVLLKNNILQIKHHLCKLLLIGNINQDDNTMIWYQNDDEEKKLQFVCKGLASYC